MPRNKRTPKSILKTLRSTVGAGLVEYGVLTGLIAVTSIGVVATLGDEVASMFGHVQTTLASEIDGDTSTEVADADEDIPFDYTNPATYPDDSECYAASGSDPYNAAYTCFLYDGGEDTTVDLASETTDDLIVKLSGPDAGDGDYGIWIEMENGTVIVDMDDEQDIWIDAYGTTQVAFPNLSCEDVTISDVGWGFAASWAMEHNITIEVEYDEDYQFETVWCGGDDVEWTVDELMNGGPAEEWTLSGGCLYYGTSNEWCQVGQPYPALPNDVSGSDVTFVWKQAVENGDYCVYDDTNDVYMSDGGSQACVAWADTSAGYFNSEDEHYTQAFDYEE